MGYNISWIGVRGRPADAVLSELKLTRVGPFDGFPFEGGMFGGNVYRNWYVIASSDVEDAFVDEHWLAAMSRDCEILACCVMENMMISLAQLWHAGSRIWLVQHDSSSGGSGDLEASGQLPDHYFSIRDACRKLSEGDGAQDGIDYIFDIPALLAWRITGFKHDREFRSGRQPQWEFLEREAFLETKRPWWKVWS